MTKPETMSPEAKAKALAAAGLTVTRALPSPELMRAGLLLIEGQYENHEIRVAMPNGECWRYRHDGDRGSRTVLCHIIMAEPRVISVFRPTAEGIHPFLGNALRFGVDSMGGVQ